jgi:protoporphyrinogen oxidase
MTKSITILGAGVAGLSAAYFATKAGINSTIYEKSDTLGGLLDNFLIDGYRFDNAVHLSFTNEPIVRKIFDQTHYNTLPADSLCYEYKNWLKHPVQNNLFPLTPDEKVNLVTSFVSRPDFSEINNYEDWLRSQYGNEIAERFPLKYTEKYWTVPASHLSISWVGNRMRRPDLKEILYGAFTADTPNTYYTKEMRYPKEGGYKSFIKPLLESAKAELNKKAVSIDLKRKEIEFDDGIKINYEHLISSLPLPLIISLIKNVPSEVKAAAKDLFATSIDLVSIGFNENIIKDLWFYIYDEEMLAARAYSPSVKSINNVPSGCSSLQFEIYSSCHKPMTLSKDEMIENTLESLYKMNIAIPKQVSVVHHKRLEYGNVVFFVGMEKKREIVLNYLKENDISSIGRFGEWEYFWSDQSLLSGKHAIDRLIINNGL